VQDYRGSCSGILLPAMAIIILSLNHGWCFHNNVKRDYKVRTEDIPLCEKPYIFDLSKLIKNMYNYFLGKCLF